MIKKLLFTATAFAAISFGANAQQTISFESSEGFTLGDINGQNGWTVTGDGNGGFIANQEVSDEMYSDGMYSFKIAYDDAFGAQSSTIMGGFYTFDAAVPHESITFDVYIDDVEGSDYNFSTANVEAEYFVSSVHFVYDGTVGIRDETGALVLATGASWTSGTWHSVKIEVVDGDIVYSIDDTVIYQATASANQLGDIDHIRFNHDNYGDEGFAYIDNIKINEDDTSTENFDKLGLNVFPNPVNDIVNITSPEANIEAITITDLNGRTVKSFNFTNVAETTVDASDLSSGIYLLNITANGTVATQKIVKK